MVLALLALPAFALAQGVPAGLNRVADGSLMAPDIARVVRRGELIVALMSGETPPFVEEREGRLVGHDIDLVRDLARSLGVEVRFDRTSTTYNGVVDLVARGLADVGVSKIARTLSRSVRVRFSDTYLHIPHAWLLNRVAVARLNRDKPIEPFVRSYSGSLGVIGHSAWEDFAARNFPQAKIVRYPTWEACVEAVKRGDVPAIYRDEYEVRSVMRRDPKLALQLRSVSFNDLKSSLAVAVNQQDLNLLAYINEFLLERSGRTAVKVAATASEGASR
jgi:ABC-type amino acid transport substrate-binding protein